MVVAGKAMQLLRTPIVGESGEIDIVIPRGSRFFYDPDTEAGNELYEDEEENLEVEGSAESIMISLGGMLAALLVWITL